MSTTATAPDIAAIVRQVIQELGAAGSKTALPPVTAGPATARSHAGAHGIFSMSPTDHLGLDQRSYVMVKIENGTWKYQP